MIALLEVCVHRDSLLTELCQAFNEFKGGAFEECKNKKKGSWPGELALPAMQ